MSTLREVAGTIQEPITLSEAKEHLRVTHDQEDSYILTLITAGRRFVENELGETLHSQTYDYFLDEFPSGNIELPKPPLISVTHIKYYDTDNAQQTLVVDTDYRVDDNSIPGIIEVIDSWPATYDRTSAVEIRFTGGYSNLSEIDPQKIHCMKLQLSILYADREGVTAEANALESMLNKLKHPSF